MGLLLSDEAQLLKLGQKTILNFPEVSLRGPVPCNNDNIIAQGIGRLRQAVSLPDAAADAISYHGVAELCTGGETEAVVVQAVFAAIDHKTPSGGTLALLVQASEQMILF